MKNRLFLFIIPISFALNSCLQRTNTSEDYILIEATRTDTLDFKMPIGDFNDFLFKGLITLTDASNGSSCPNKERDFRTFIAQNDNVYLSEIDYTTKTWNLIASDKDKSEFHSINGVTDLLYEDAVYDFITLDRHKALLITETDDIIMIENDSVVKRASKKEVYNNASFYHLKYNTIRNHVSLLFFEHQLLLRFGGDYNKVNQKFRYDFRQLGLLDTNDLSFTPIDYKITEELNNRGELDDRDFHFIKVKDSYFLRCSPEDSLLFPIPNISDNHDPIELEPFPDSVMAEHLLVADSLSAMVRKFAYKPSWSDVFELDSMDLLCMVGSIPVGKPEVKNGSILINNYYNFIDLYSTNWKFLKRIPLNAEKIKLPAYNFGNNAIYISSSFNPTAGIGEDSLRIARLIKFEIK